MLTVDQISKACKFNLNHAPSPFFCPVQRILINPTEPEGVEWIAKMQEYMDDPWESKHGDPEKRLDIDGMLGRKTLAALESRYGRLSSAVDFDTIHPMPLLIAYWGYDMSFDWGNTDWPEKDEQWEEFTSGGTWHHGMLRLVTGWDPRFRTFNRTPRDHVSLDEMSIGFAHYWADVLPGFLAAFVNALFALAVDAWGLETAEKMRSEDWIASQIDAVKGKRSHQAKYNWLLTGWWYAGKNEDAMRWQSEYWLQHYYGYVRKVVVDMKWTNSIPHSDGGQVIAGIMRMTNSAGRRGTTEILEAARNRIGSNDPMKVLENAYTTDDSKGGYGKEDRWEIITTWDEFAGPAPKTMKL